MIKEYRGTKTIMAEQFTDKNEQVKRYRLYHRAFIEDGESWVITTPEGPMPVHYGDWIATGVYAEHWVIVDEIFKKNYEELPGQRTIPLEVDTFKNESATFGGIFVCQRIQRSKNFNY